MPKHKNKPLLIVFIVLLAIAGASWFFGGEKERNFRDVLVAVDTTQVNRIAIYPRSENKTEILLQRQGEDWQATKEGLTVTTRSGVVKSLLSELTDVKPARLVALSKEAWPKYEIGDSLGTEVKVYQDDQLLADFVVGKFNFQPNTRSAITFVRLAEEEDIYAVDGFLGASFDKAFNTYRDNTFLSLNKDNLRNIQFQYPGDSAFTMIKADSLWKIGEQQPDSTVLVSYLSGISNKSSNNFEDTFDPGGKLPLYQVTFGGNNMTAVTVKCYAMGGSQYVLHSSQNNEAYFSSQADGWHANIFASKAGLLPVTE